MKRMDVPNPLARYAESPMKDLFEESYQLTLWFDVELAVIEAKESLNLAPAGTAQKIKERVKIEPEVIREHEKRLRHDVLAFVKHVNDQIGDLSRFFHAGVTSYDIVDTALSLQLTQALRLLQEDTAKLAAAVKALGVKHKQTPMMGRTHGQDAEPIAFGHKLAVWYAEIVRHEQRLSLAFDQMRVGKLSGAVGQYAHLPPQVEAEALRILGLEPAPASSQILQRDRHAFLTAVIAGLGASLEKMATELRLLQSSAVGEVREAFAEGQRGSSAMPHKKNPITAEKVTGLARLLRGYSAAAFENVALWNERDLSNSAPERFIFSHAFCLLDHMCKCMERLFGTLQVDEARMRENIERSRGLYASQRVLLKLMEKGMGREEAYDLVQRAAFEASEEGRHLKEVLAAAEETRGRLCPEELEACFDPGAFLAHTGEIYRRVGW